MFKIRAKSTLMALVLAIAAMLFAMRQKIRMFPSVIITADFGLL